MADGGSAIAPLGAMHSLDEESAALLTPADAPALISATTSNLASAAHQGFMPSMIAMLFGPVRLLALARLLQKLLRRDAVWAGALARLFNAALPCLAGLLLLMLERRGGCVCASNVRSPSP